MLSTSTRRHALRAGLLGVVFVSLWLISAPPHMSPRSARRAHIQAPTSIDQIFSFRKPPPSTWVELERDIPWTTFDGGEFVMSGEPIWNRVGRCL